MQNLLTSISTLSIIFVNIIHIKRILRKYEHICMPTFIFSVAKLPDPHTGDGYPETVVVVTGLTLGRGGIGT